MEENSERIDIRMPKTLLRQIEKYQSVENISNRSTAMFELIRIGLHSDKDVDIEVMRGDSQRIDIRVPVGLLKRIEEYQDSQQIKTRAKAMKELVIVGLTKTIGNGISAN